MKDFSPIHYSAVFLRSTLLLAALGLGPAFSAKAATATFDFDTGSPTLTAGQGVPFNQTSDGITASFSAASGAFSLQTDASLGFTLSQFSGKYLYPNTAGSVLTIQFSQMLTNLTFAFATADFPPIEIPTPIVLTAYTNSASTPPVGSVSVRGTYGSDTLPMGTLTFSSATPFNLGRLNIQPGGGMGFLMDNITVQSPEVSTYTITTSAAPGAGGSTSGDGTYTSGASVTVVATANAGYAFVNWTEDGTPVSASASYTFMAGANRALVANFALPTLQSSATVEGPYSDDLTAVIDGTLQTITTTVTLPTSFYRLRCSANTQFTQVQVTGDRMVLRYTVL